ncbi:MAG: hypothetical protein ACRDVP_08835 [Acidimicrobiales bacterium]
MTSKTNINHVFNGHVALDPTSVDPIPSPALLQRSVTASDRR